MGEGMTPVIELNSRVRAVTRKRSRERNLWCTLLVGRDHSRPPHRQEDFSLLSSSVGSSL